MTGPRGGGGRGGRGGGDFSDSNFGVGYSGHRERFLPILQQYCPQASESSGNKVKKFKSTFVVYLRVNIGTFIVSVNNVHFCPNIMVPVVCAVHCMAQSLLVISNFLHFAVKVFINIFI